MLTCGVDIGSRSIEIVLFDGAQVVETVITDSGSDPRGNAARAMERAIAAAGHTMDDVEHVVATGYGRNHFEHAHSTASEIMCHAQGIYYLFPEARTVIDIGGQDSKTIALGPEGKVMNFAMNDRCAAGTGKFIEMVGHTLQISPDQMGVVTEGGSEHCNISSMCAVFAESEIISLIQSGTSVDVVLRGVFKAIARRTLSLMGKVQVTDMMLFTGGVAKNGGVVRALEEETGFRIQVPYEPQITGALGAAVIAANKTVRSV